MRRCIFGLTVAVAITALATTVHAQEQNYPNRPVHILAAAAPGGNPDVLARLLSQRLSEVLGQPFVVENVPGAGGILAAKRIADAAPDGYMLMLNDSGALAININMSPDATYKLKDFTPITALATVPTALVIIPSVPANNVNEFIALAKAKPDAMTYGSAGAGSIHHLTMEIFAERTGIKLLHVPYRGGSALVNGFADWRNSGRMVRLAKRDSAYQGRQVAWPVRQRARALFRCPTFRHVMRRVSRASTSPICWACRVPPGYRRSRSSDCRQRLQK
jgi:tripartite-type tricarboxylate transporter receptor subunit TctC